MHVGSRLGLIGGVLPPIYEFLYEISDGYNHSTVTWSNVPFGTATSDRLIVINVHGFRLANVTMTATIGGVAATIHQSYVASTIQVYTASAIVPTGTTGDVVLNFNNTHYIIGMNVHSIKGLTNYTPYITEESITTSGVPLVTVTTIDANSVLIGHCISYDTAGNNIVWSGLTERNDYNGHGRVNHTSAAAVFTTAQTNYVVSATPSAGTSNRRMQILGFK